MLKGERFGWVLQKGTEVGVSVFMPVICERNVVDDMEAVEDKRERWETHHPGGRRTERPAFLPQLLPAQLFQQAVQPRRGRKPALPRPSGCCCGKGNRRQLNGAGRL